MLVLCAVTLVVWLENPFAAALLVPALHLWLWIVAPERRLRAPWSVLLFLAGLVPLASGRDLLRRRWALALRPRPGMLC